MLLSKIFPKKMTVEKCELKLLRQTKNLFQKFDQEQQEKKRIHQQIQIQMQVNLLRDNNIDNQTIQLTTPNFEDLNQLLFGSISQHYNFQPDQEPTNDIDAQEVVDTNYNLETISQQDKKKNDNSKKSALQFLNLDSHLKTKRQSGFSKLQLAANISMAKNKLKNPVISSIIKGIVVKDDFTHFQRIIFDHERLRQHQLIDPSAKQLNKYNSLLLSFTQKRKVFFLGQISGKCVYSKSSRSCSLQNKIYVIVHLNNLIPEYGNEQDNAQNFNNIKMNNNSYNNKNSFSQQQEQKNGANQHYPPQIVLLYSPFRNQEYLRLKLTNDEQIEKLINLVQMLDPSAEELQFNNNKKPFQIQSQQRLAFALQVFLNSLNINRSILGRSCKMTSLLQQDDSSKYKTNYLFENKYLLTNKNERILHKLLFSSIPECNISNINVIHHFNKKFQLVLYHLKVCLLANQIYEGNFSSTFLNSYFQKAVITQHARITGLGSVLITASSVRMKPSHAFPFLQSFSSVLSQYRQNPNNNYNDNQQQLQKQQQQQNKPLHHNYVKLQEQLIFVIVNVQQRENNSRLAKMIFHISDINALVRSFTEPLTFENCLDRILLSRVMQQLSIKLVYAHSGAHPGRTLQIPMRYLSLTQDKNKYDLVNSFKADNYINQKANIIFSKNQERNQPKNNKKKGKCCGSGSQNKLFNLSQKVLRQQHTDKKSIASQNNNANLDTNNIIQAQTISKSKKLGLQDTFTTLTPVLRSSVIVIQKIVKLRSSFTVQQQQQQSMQEQQQSSNNKNNNKITCESYAYTVVTIRRFSNILDQYKYQINLYVPSTSRVWVGYAQISDFVRFQPSFMESLFPSLFWIPSYQGLIQEFMCWTNSKNRSNNNNINFGGNSLLEATLSIINSNNNLNSSGMVGPNNINNANDNNPMKASIMSLQLEQQQQLLQFSNQFQQAQEPLIQLQKFPQNTIKLSYNHDYKEFSKVFDAAQENPLEVAAKYVQQVSQKFVHVQEILNQLGELGSNVSIHSLSPSPIIIKQGYGIPGSKPSTLPEFMRKKRSKLIPNVQSKLYDLSQYKKDPYQFLQLFSGLQTDCSSFFEMKIWEEFISNFEIEKSSNMMFQLNIDQFNCLLREELHQSIICLSNGLNAHVEIFLDTETLMMASSAHQAQQQHMQISPSQFNVNEDSNNNKNSNTLTNNSLSTSNNNPYNFLNVSTNNYNNNTQQSSSFHNNGSNTNSQILGLFLPFPPIRLLQTFSYIVYMRINHLETPRTTNDKLPLRKLLASFYTEFPNRLNNRRLKQQQQRLGGNNKSNNSNNSNVYAYEFVLADFKQLGLFCISKIKDCFVLSSSSSATDNRIKSNKRSQFKKQSQIINTKIEVNSISNQKNINNNNYVQDFFSDDFDAEDIDEEEEDKNQLDGEQYPNYKNTVMHMKDNFLQYLKSDQLLISDKHCPAVMKVNSKMDLAQIFYQNKKHYTLLLRTVFTKRPLQAIALFYRQDKKCFYAFIWNIANGCHAKQKIRMRDVMYKIPHIKLMLRLKLYLEIGHRIFLTMKNSLLISSFNKLNIQF